MASVPLLVKNDRAVDGFRAAVGEERAIKAGPCGELARERALIGVVIEIREVNGARRFATDHSYDSRVRVTERVDGNAAQEIEIFLAGGVIDVRALAVSHDRGLTFVGGQKKLFGIEQARVGFGGWHNHMFGLAR